MRFEACTVVNNIQALVDTNTLWDKEKVPVVIHRITSRAHPLYLSLVVIHRT
jgi:hypothetical protein